MARPGRSDRLFRFLVLAAVGFVALGAAPANSTTSMTADADADRYVVLLDDASGESRLEAAGMRVIDRLEGTGFVLAAGSQGAAERAAALPAVADIRPPVPIRAAATPNDPMFTLQWNLPAIQVPGAWSFTRGKGAVVAVLDTGVDTSIEDFAGTTFTAPFDFVEADAVPQDDNGHGTHVTGTIAQTTDNGIGVAGVAPAATIMPLKVLDGAGAGDDWALAEALHWAADRGARVANLSLGGPTGSLLMQEAVTYATSRGVTVVAAVGNQGQDGVAYPAAYSEVIAVGAVRYDRALAPYSNRGPELDLVAPGGDGSVDQNGDGHGDAILQQTNQTVGGQANCYCFYQGTSMATPHVAGVAALLVAAGTTDPTAIRAALTASALDLGAAGHDAKFGFGLLQAKKALELAAAGTAQEPDRSGDPSADDPLVPPPSSSDPDPDTAPAAPRDIEDACPSGEVPKHGYSDVDGGAHEPAIACLSWLDIAAGVGGSRYAPDGVVRRDQMAAFLARTLEAVGVTLPSSPPDAFVDDERSAHEHRIDQLAAIGIITGGVGATYAPNTAVSREQMATFVVRLVEQVTGTAINAQIDQFDDDNESRHEARIDAVATVSIAVGTDFRTFAPDVSVRRDQMASFLARALDYLTEQGYPAS